MPKATTKALRAAVPRAGPDRPVCPTRTLFSYSKCVGWSLGGGGGALQPSHPATERREPVLQAAADKDKGLWAPADLACQRLRPTLPSLLIKVGLCSLDSAPHLRVLCWRLI